MRDQHKDSGRISHMAEMAQLLETERSKHTQSELQSDCMLF